MKYFQLHPRFRHKTLGIRVGSFLQWKKGLKNAHFVTSPYGGTQSFVSLLTVCNSFSVLSVTALFTGCYCSVYYQQVSATALFAACCCSFYCLLLLALLPATALFSVCYCSLYCLLLLSLLLLLSFLYCLLLLSLLPATAGAV